MNRIVSIDWRFFVKEDPALGWEHKEDESFLVDDWEKRRHKVLPSDPKNGLTVTERVDLTKVVPFVGDPVGIVQFIVNISRLNRLLIAESHSKILDGLDGKRDLEIFNFDAHHDLDKGEWGHRLITEGRVVSWTQIYPSWRREFPDTPAPECGAIFTDVFPRLKPASVIDMIFLCRSGHYTPPEYDAEFNKLVRVLSSGQMEGLDERPIL
jgi:hypothetical protein